MVFLPLPTSQIDGTPFAQANCGPAVTCELIGLASVDALRFTPSQVRRAAGDFSGGIEGAALAKAANDLTNYLYPLVYTHMADFRDVREVWKHRPIALVIDAGVTVNTKWRTNSFTGNHWVTVAGGSEKDGTVKVEDPGTTAAGWKRWPIDLLKRASDFGGYHFFLQGPATEDTDREATRAVAVRAKPDRTAPRLGGLVKGKEVHVIRTTRGGPWLRPDGTTGHGWHVIAYQGGRGFVTGKGLR